MNWKRFDRARYGAAFVLIALAVAVVMVAF